MVLMLTKNNLDRCNFVVNINKLIMYRFRSIKDTINNTVILYSLVILIVFDGIVWMRARQVYHFFLPSRVVKILISIAFQNPHLKS